MVKNCPKLPKKQTKGRTKWDKMSHNVPKLPKEIGKVCNFPNTEDKILKGNIKCEREKEREKGNTKDKREKGNTKVNSVESTLSILHCAT